MSWWITAIENLVVGGIGGMATVYGLSKFLGDVWLERIRDALLRDQKRLQAGLDRHVFVTRTQFETEFDSLKQVFKALSEVMLALNGLRPSVSVRPSNETQEEKKRRLFERLALLQGAYDDLVGRCTGLSPFYPKDISEAVHACLRIANTEIMMVQTSPEHEEYRVEWFQEAERNRREFAIAYEKVSTLMRDRISSLTVLP